MEHQNIENTDILYAIQRFFELDPEYREIYLQENIGLMYQVISSITKESSDLLIKQARLIRSQTKAALKKSDINLTTDQLTCLMLGALLESGGLQSMLLKDMDELLFSENIERWH